MNEADSERADFYLGVPSVIVERASKGGSIGVRSEPVIAFHGTLKELQLFASSQKRRVHWWNYLIGLWEEIGGIGWVSVLVGDMRKSWESIPRPLAIARPVDTFHHVLLPFNSRRHFDFFEDRLSWEDKKASAIFRGSTTGDLWGPGGRGLLVKRWVKSSKVNIGFSKISNTRVPKTLIKGEIAKAKQLQYRMIVSVEGNDVASGLKWQMASRSVVAMCKPRVVSWFREDALIPWIHYVPLEESYSDLVEKLDWVNSNPKKSSDIVSAANSYCAKFMNTSREREVAKEVLRDYISLTIPASKMAPNTHRDSMV